MIGPYKNAATSQSASISGTGTITGTSLALGTGGIGCGGITVSGANGITLSSTSYTPIINQLGYTVSVLNNFSAASIAANTNVNITSATIPAGTYLVHFAGGGPTSGQYNIGISTTTASFDTNYTVAATTNATLYTSNFIRPALTVIIQNTASTVWYLNHLSNTGGYISTRITWYYTRIA